VAGQRGVEVVDGLAAPIVCPTVNLEGENIVTPSILNRLLCIPKACLPVFDFLDQKNVV
jgi:hypothetical protein